ncbi:MAG: GNAT family N-acetyltransferase [Alphaproteobacteria bacterium]|nr:GNAT family N-acetyltransferase [Alphaproteobacteria bacterium]
MIIRSSLATDLPAIAAIYGHHVLHGTGTFETEPPSLEEMTRRWQTVTEAGWPHLVLCVDHQVLGFAYAQPFRPRQAYRHTLEDSIYLAPDAVRKGHGRALLAELVARSELVGGRQMIAVIGDSTNRASIGLHAALGFAHTGLLKSSGWKHGRWLDVVLMQRPLGLGDESLPATEVSAPSL